MGIGLGAFQQLTELAARFKPDGPSAMLGRQVLNMRGAMKRRGPRAIRPYQKVLSAHFPSLSAEDLLQDDPFAETMFDALGFADIESIDISDYEGATRVWDMNAPVPKDWHGRYSLIFDGGTLEHVFNVPQAFANVFNMLQVGGRFVGANPFNGFLSHGLYQFSAELVWTYWKHGCGCTMHTCRAIDRDGRFVRDLPDPTASGMRLKLRSGPSFLGRFPRDKLILWYEIEKLDGSKLPADIQQSDYVTSWSQASTEASQ